MASILVGRAQPLRSNCGHRCNGKLLIGLLVALVAGQKAIACNDCGCGGADLPDDAEVCEPHMHADGSTHSQGSTTSAAPLALDVSPAAGMSSLVQRFVVVGDTQSNGSGGTGPSGSAGPRGFMPQMIENINSHNASRLLLAGDLVNTGGNGSWNDWIAEAQNFNGGLQNVLMTPGNHDQPSGTDALWRSKFSQTPGGQAWLPNSQNINGRTGFNQMDYYVDEGTTRFISVTTDTQAFGASNLAASSLAWMQQALIAAEANPAIEDVFVYTHHPVTFDSTYTGSANRAGTQADMWQSLTSDSEKVRALFTGHWHLYQPSTPDPDNADVWEVVTGTGGGGLEGRAAQNQHGFTVVDIHGDGRIEAAFYGDSDGASNGWDFNDIMDQFNITNPNPAPAGLVAYYGFNTAGRNLDQAVTAQAKQNHGFYNNNAASISGGVLGRTLSLDGSGDYADGASFGDYNLAINGNLTLSIHANFDSLVAGADENTLVTYGSALYDNNTPGSNELESEAVNIAYSLRLRDDKRLEILWERDNGVNVVMASTAAANVNAGEWHHYVVSRDIDANQLLFFVDGAQLGAPVSFNDSQQPTGGGSGFLHVGSALYGDGGFDGLLDEFTVYNSVILPGQVFTGAQLGDLDGDSDVDLDDFLNEFRTVFGETLASDGSAATLADGDYDLDGDVDLLDFDAFQTYYLDANPGAAPLSFSVPEPAGFLLAAIAGLIVIGRQRRQTPVGASLALPRPGSVLVVVAALTMGGAVGQAASLIHDYQFGGNLDDALGGPALNSGGGALGLNGYNFGGGQGLSLSNWDPTNLGDDYSIEFYARFSSFGNGSYGKLVDFKNRGSDNGFYIRNISGGNRPIFF
ncbi:metallophosphoesterase, partial [Pirellulales bacterium]|nr:metallophosphoesterase [Pirellulales bacterium]